MSNSLSPVWIATAGRWLIYALFITSSFSMAGMSGAAIFLSWLFIYHWRYSEARQMLQGPIWWSFVWMALAFLISALLSAHPLQSLKAIQELWRYLLPFAVALYFKQVDDRRLLRGIAWLWGAMALYGIFQYFWGFDLFRAAEHSKMAPYKPDGVPTGVFHAKGNFSHHLTYAHYLLLTFPLLASLIGWPSASWRFRVLAGLGSGLMLGGLMLSLGRSAWLGALVALMILALQLSRRWLMGLFFAIILGGTLFLARGHWESSFASYGQEIHSGLKARLDSLFVLRHHRDRLFLWESATLAIRDHFWFGIGLHNDEFIMPLYRAQVEQAQHHTFLNRASAGVHNIYLQTWINFGLFGLLAYLTMWGSLLGTAILWLKRAPASCTWERSLLWGILAGFGGLMLAGCFENNFRDGEVQTILFALIGWELHLVQKIRQAWEASI